MNFGVSILKLLFNCITRQRLAFSYQAFQVLLLLIVFGKLPLIVLVVGTSNSRSLPAALPLQQSDGFTGLFVSLVACCSGSLLILLDVCVVYQQGAS